MKDKAPTCSTMRVSIQTTNNYKVLDSADIHTVYDMHLFAQKRDVEKNDKRSDTWNFDPYQPEAGGVL